MVRTSVTHSAVPRVPLFCSYHILTSSVIYYWTDARQLGIYLLTMSLPFSHALDRLTVFTSEFLFITSISLVSLYPQSIAESAPSRNKLPNPGTSLGTEMSYWLTFLRPPTTSIVISIAGRRNYGRFAYRLFAYVQHVSSLTIHMSKLNCWKVLVELRRKTEYWDEPPFTVFVFTCDSSGLHQRRWDFIN